MKVGDRVRPKPGSDLRARLGDRATVAIVAPHQVDDDELRISLLFDDPQTGCTTSLSADDFEFDRTRPDEPF